MGFIDTAIGATLGFAVGGPAGAAVGAGIGAGMDTNQANAERADAANAWSAAQYASRYQTTVKDLQAAGLNPMLAYSQGAGSAPTAQQVQFQNPVSSGMQAYQQYAGAQQAISSASQADAMTKQVDATTNKIIEETKNVPLEGRRLERTAALLAEELNLVYQRTQSEIQTRSVMGATIKKIGAETNLLDNQIAVEKALDNLGRTSKEYAPAVKMMLDIFRTMSK